MIDIQTFGGRAPKITARKLAEHMAQTAQNCNFESGSLESMLQVTQVQNLGATNYQTLWKRGDTWTVLTTDSWVINSFVDDDKDKLFWTDPLTFPKKSDDDLWPATRRLGITPPSVAATLTHLGTAGTDIQAVVSYVYTLVSEWGEESMPSPVSAVETVYEGEGIQLTGLTTPTGTNNSIEYKRIYRLSAGTSGAEFQFLAEIDESETSYNDFNVDQLLDVETDVLTTTYWNPPPDELTGMIHCHNGIVAGYVGKTLYLSEVMVPYAFPEAYQFEFDYPITGVGCFGETIIVITEEKPWAVIGLTPESMYKKPLDYPQSCVSPKSVLGTPEGVYYASPDGICLCNGETVEVITAAHITKAQWNSYDIANLKLVKYDGKLYGFFLGDADGIIFDTASGELSDFDLDQATVASIQDIYQEGTTDTLYLLTRGTDDTDYIYSFGTGSTGLGYTWKSKEFTHPESYTCAKVEGDYASGTVSFRYYLDGTLVLTKTLSSASVFKLPARGYNPYKAVEVVGSIQIDRIRCAQSSKELR